MNLALNHIADLRASGLCDEQIDAAGFWTERDTAAVRDLLRWDYAPAEPWPCLAIPYLDAAGRHTGYARLKPDSPRAGEKGRPVRYESPRGIPPRCFFPPWYSARSRAGCPLVLTEGEKKAACVDQYAFACIGLTGVYGWQIPRGHTRGAAERRLLPDLAAAVAGRSRVYLAFDSDAATNRDVVTARWNLAATLVRAGLTALVVHITPGRGGVKRAVDDVLRDSGPAELAHLIRWASRATMPRWA